MLSRSATSLLAASDNKVPYLAGACCFPTASQEADDITIATALDVLRSRLKHRDVVAGAQDVKNYLSLCAATYGDVEVFSVMFLDPHQRILAHEALFFGSLTQTTVYPREVVRRALAHSAASVIFSHNHPSGSAEPSAADQHLTQKLTAALALLDIRVLDHIIVAGPNTLSFAERGLL